MKTLTPQIEQLIIEVKLIDPLKKIIALFETGSIRDCDIKWLDAQFEKFVLVAAETFGIKGIPQSAIQPETFTHFNDYVKNIYINRFKTLLDYFKTFDQLI